MYYINPLIKDLVRIFPEGNREDYLRLDMNENPEGLPIEFIEKCKAKINPEFVSSYPNRESLTKALSKYHGLEEDNFCITDGSEMAIKYIYETFGERGKKVLTVSPTFEMYDVYSKMFGLEHVTYEIGKDFKINVDNFIDLIDYNTSLVCILNPNNPIGGVYKQEDIIRIIERADECDAVVVIDEAYHYFIDETSIELVNKYNNIIILRTFSKLFSLASCRIGYAVSCNNISKLLNKVRPTFDTNSFALLFAEMAIKDIDLKNYLINVEKTGRNYLIEQLETNKYDYYFGGGNYIFIKPKKDLNYIVDKLHDSKILVKTYRKGVLKEYIRINTGSKNIMKKFFDIFIDIDIDIDMK